MLVCNDMSPTDRSRRPAGIDMELQCPIKESNLISKAVKANKEYVPSDKQMASRQSGRAKWKGTVSKFLEVDAGEKYGHEWGPTALK